MDKCENKKKRDMRLKHFQAEVKMHCNIRGFLQKLVISMGLIIRLHSLNTAETSRFPWWQSPAERKR